jgi:hypothetical protein
MGKASHEIRITIRVAFDFDEESRSPAAGPPTKVVATSDAAPDAGGATLARVHARLKIRDQRLPTIQEIREKLEVVDVLNLAGDRISAEALHAVFSAYRSAPFQRGKWWDHESLAEVRLDDQLFGSSLERALDVFGLGRRLVVFTRDLVIEAYRLSFHDLSASEIAEMLGLDASKVDRMLRRLSAEDRMERHNTLAWVDDRFVKSHGLSPSEYRSRLRQPR